MPRIIITEKHKRNPRDNAQIRALFEGNENYAYWDTLGIFMRYPPEPVLKTIVGLQRGSGDVQLKRMIYTDSTGKERTAGATTIIQRPNDATLNYLDHIERKYQLKFAICMADLAFDSISNDEKTKTEKTQIIRDRLILRNRRPGLMRQDEFTLGWNNQADRASHISKNLVLYDDEPSKETGEDYCTHLELRLRRASLLRGNGIETIEDLRNVNPHELLNRNVRLTTFSQEDKARHINRVVRNSYRKNFYKPKDKRHAAFAERYNAGLARKLYQIACRGLHAGQAIKDGLGARNKRFSRSIDIDALNIPRALSIPRVISSPVVSIDKIQAGGRCDDMDIGRDVKRHRVKLNGKRGGRDE